MELSRLANDFKIKMMMMIKMTNVDFLTQIFCDECEARLVHRYRCDCAGEWGYCTNDSHVCFYCHDCDSEKKVDWDTSQSDNSGQFVMSRMEKERLNMVIADTARDEKERVALKKLFDDWENPEIEASPFLKVVPDAK